MEARLNETEESRNDLTARLLEAERQLSRKTKQYAAGGQLHDSLR
jgi:hypothetical protein